MYDKRNLHLKVQEMCDCFVTTEPIAEMRAIEEEPDKDEAAVKWIALAILYGIDHHAKKLSISRRNDGRIKVKAKDAATELPTPSPEIGRKVIETIKQIAHFEESGKGKMPFALGIRDSGIELGLELDRGKDKESISFKFPDWSAN